jgi:hypothetical protein
MDDARNTHLSIAKKREVGQESGEKARMKRRR